MVNSIVFSVFLGGLIYLILAAQLQSGFPPFYNRLPSFLFWGVSKDDDEMEREIKRILPFVFALIAVLALAVATGWHVFFGLSGVIAFSGGIRIRQDLLKTTAGPLPWLSSYWTHRWPMLVFDIWTLGFATLFAILTLI